MTYQVFAVVMLVCIYLAVVAVSVHGKIMRGILISTSFGLFSALMAKVIIEIVQAMSQM